MSARPIDRDKPDSIMDERHGMDALVATRDAVPETGSLVEARDGRYGESLPVIWEVEPGRMLSAGSLPDVTTGVEPRTVCGGSRGRAAR